MLQNADPTGEIQPDSQELLELEDHCYMMGPLIDKQLQKIDHKHVILEDLNLKILEAFQIYNNLMKESISKTVNFINPSLSATSSLNTLSANLNRPMNMPPNSIPYAAAPPTIEQNPLLLANQLSNMAAGGFNPNAPAPNSLLPNAASAYDPAQQPQYAAPQYPNPQFSNQQMPQYSNPVLNTPNMGASSLNFNNPAAYSILNNDTTSLPAVLPSGAQPGYYQSIN